MATAKPDARSLADAFVKIMCTDPVIYSLTPEQLAALHVCKHEMLASIYRLYMVVPQKTADQVLKKYFKVPAAG